MSTLSGEMRKWAAGEDMPLGEWIMRATALDAKIGGLKAKNKALKAEVDRLEAGRRRWLTRTATAAVIDRIEGLCRTIQKMDDQARALEAELKRLQTENEVLAKKLTFIEAIPPEEDEAEIEGLRVLQLGKGKFGVGHTTREGVHGVSIAYLDSDEYEPGDVCGRGKGEIVPHEKVRLFITSTSEVSYRVLIDALRDAQAALRGEEVTDDDTEIAAPEAQDWESEVPPDVPEKFSQKYSERKTWGHWGHGAWKRHLRKCLWHALDSYTPVVAAPAFAELVNDPDFWLFLLGAVEKGVKDGEDTPKNAP